MAVETAADRAALLADFGESVTMTPKGYPHPSSKTATITAIFDRTYVEVLNISGERPVLTCREADLTANGIGKGANVTANGTAYSVPVSPQTDGTGMAQVILEET